MARRVWTVILVSLLVVACSPGGGASPSIVPGQSASPSTAATQGPTPTPEPTPTPAASEGVPAPDLGDLLGTDIPPVPAGTTWTRISDDTGALSFEVPSTWTNRQTVPWQEEDGTTSGTLLVAAPAGGQLGDFGGPAVAIGVTANPTGRSVDELAASEDNAAYCTPTPVERSGDATYTAAFRIWTDCDGRPEAFVLVIVISPAGSSAIVAVVFQGAAAADLGLVEHVLGSLGGGTATASPAPTQPPQNSQGYTATVDECLLQMNDAIALGVVTNTDTRSHGYRVVVRFLDKDGLLLGESHWNVPALDPGQSGRYEVRLMAMNGVTQVTCVLSEVLLLN